MQVQVKIISSHNLSRHMNRENAEIFDENMRGVKKSELSILNLKNTPKGFIVSEDDQRIEGMGYNGIEFFRRYLLDDFFTITYRLQETPDLKDRIKNEIYKAIEVCPSVEITDLEDDLFPILDYDYTYKLRVSRNGFIHVIMEKEVFCDKDFTELENLVNTFLVSKYKGFIPLVIGDFFVRQEKNVTLVHNPKKCVSEFLPTFYSDKMYQKKLSRSIFPQHNAYIFARMPASGNLKVIDNLFAQTDIFIIRQNIKTLQVNPNISMILNDNLCFIKCKEFSDKELNASIAIQSFIRMLEYLFTISTELETILKNTTLMLEDIAKVNKDIIEEEKNKNWDMIDKEIQRLMQKLSRNYRMLPHIRDILVGTTAFKNMEIIVIVEEILKIFHLYKTEKWIKQNIDEINNFITHFHTIQSYEREKRSNKRLNRIFLLLSGLQVPSFIKDFGETLFIDPSANKYLMLGGNGLLLVILVSLAVYFHLRGNKL